MTPALRLTGLRKAFGDRVAVDDVDLVVPPGSFFGLVGPNGAGKTTALSMAVGLLRPGGGRSEVYGHDVWSDPVGPRRCWVCCPTAWPCPNGSLARGDLRPAGRR